MDSIMEQDKRGHKEAAERIMELARAIHRYQIKYEREHDGRAIFACVYHKITLDRAKDLIAGDKGFDDPDWLTNLTEAFAGRFFKAMDALDAWLKDTASDESSTAIEKLYKTVPKPWADVYLTIRGNQSCVLEDLLFAMMAHISHDLPLALLEVKLETNGQSHVADYHRMNDVLAHQTSYIETAVTHRYNRFLAFLDKIAGYYGDFFTNYGIRVARSLAWYNAYRLLDPYSEKEARQSITSSTAQFIQNVRYPREWYLKIPIELIRLLTPVQYRWRRKWPKNGN